MIIKAAVPTVTPSIEIPEIIWTIPDTLPEKKYFLAMEKVRFNSLYRPLQTWPCQLSGQYVFLYN